VTGEAANPAPRLSRAAGGSLFGLDVDGYARGRIGYPDGLYDAIAARCGPTPRVLEIGPGTGLATREILAHLEPSALTAVEADRALANYLAQTICDPRVSIICAGFAEADVAGPFDLACCAAAFHWLDPDVAFARLRRLVRPGGTLAIWWNTYRQAGIGDAFADAVIPLLDGVALAPSEGASGHYSLDEAAHRSAFAKGGFFDVAAHQFRRERTLTVDEVQALYASYSYVRALQDVDRNRLLDTVTRLAEFKFGGRIPNVTLTALYVGTAPADS
jgi:SAM-dependent methyltransferase